MAACAAAHSAQLNSAVYIGRYPAGFPFWGEGLLTLLFFVRLVFVGALQLLRYQSDDEPV